MSQSAAAPGHQTAPPVNHDSEMTGDDFVGIEYPFVYLDHPQPEPEELNYAAWAVLDAKEQAYDATVADMITAIHDGDGTRAAALIKKAYKERRAYLTFRYLSNDGRTAVEANQLAQKNPSSRIVGKAFGTVLRVVKQAIRSRYEQQRHIRDQAGFQRPGEEELTPDQWDRFAWKATHFAARANKKKVCLDPYDQERERHERVLNIIRGKNLAADDLRARLEELGDKMIPPRSDFHVDDTMPLKQIHKIKKKETKALQRHLKCFGETPIVGYAGASTAGTAYKANTREKKQGDTNDVVSGMSKMPGFEGLVAEDMDEDNDNDGVGRVAIY